VGPSQYALTGNVIDTDSVAYFLFLHNLIQGNNGYNTTQELELG